MLSFKRANSSPWLAGYGKCSEVALSVHALVDLDCLSIWRIRMLCSTLHQLFELCHSQQPQFSPADLIRVACNNCSSTEVCPAMNDDEYNARGLDLTVRTQHVEH